MKRLRRFGAAFWGGVWDVVTDPPLTMWIVSAVMRRQGGIWVGLGELLVLFAMAWWGYRIMRGLWQSGRRWSRLWILRKAAGYARESSSRGSAARGSETPRTHCCHRRAHAEPTFSRWHR